MVQLVVRAVSLRMGVVEEKVWTIVMRRAMLLYYTRAGKHTTLSRDERGESPTAVPPASSDSYWSRAFERRFGMLALGCHKP